MTNLVITLDDAEVFAGEVDDCHGEIRRSGTLEVHATFQPTKRDIALPTRTLI